MHSTPHRAGRGRRRPAWLALGLSVALGALGAGPAAAAPAPRCDRAPTGVQTSDYWLDFTVPAGLMPDPRFDGRPARIQVHRVQPSYANGRCRGLPTRAAVLVHGRTVPGPAAFDLRHPAPEGGELSVQKALAQAGIDTFAPSLLGYGLSTRFADGLDDPGNASLRGYDADGSCPYPEGCDRTHDPVFPLDQQGSLLMPHPLQERVAHSSDRRFARTDVWVRDIRQVIDDAVARARPTNGKVTLVGASFGAVQVGRALYAANPVLPDSSRTLSKVNRVVFLSSPFGLPTEETTPPGGFATFPLTLGGRPAEAPLPSEREAVCTGRRIPGAADRLWTQMQELDPLGSTWGGAEPGNPSGLSRTPTFSAYGWNAAVAGQLSPPTLVVHGLDDREPSSPPSNATALYDALPASMTRKVLVQVQCASHSLPQEGCTGARCTPASGIPYGGRPGEPWAGPHATLKAALIEWIGHGTFGGAPNGRFVVDESGVANPAT
ncbi:alpha/beta hydrolase [Streptomyces sp. NPDC048349]|uniref:alpha/beta hydrolase n=1 Tax=Streptomyces sp. NPDC048349 TaxID=3155486 RepID=UPI00341242E8